jgi:choline dehydrogenase-like flavoprotein
MYQFIGGDFLNFAGRTFPDGTTLATCGVDVILNATLVGIEQESGRVRRLRVASMQMDPTQPPAPATTFFIEADVVVLACGAVENARQLLLSDVGNGHDQVGRYFMCHPLSGGGMIRILQPYLDDAESRLMDGQDPQGQWNAPGTGVRVSGRFVPDADTLLHEGIGACWFWAGGGQYYFEMAPNPDSRVMLSTQLDPVFGQRQALIDWRLSDLDQRTYEVSTSRFLGAVAARGGEAWAADWDSIRSSLVVNGHHIGTTRMSAVPENGVVDVDLRVHGVDNLYVAGSSVFPSTGISNPTFTIITLSMRLADHLAARLGRPAAARQAPAEAPEAVA